jgi:hypothetical protein
MSGLGMEAIEPREPGSLSLLHARLNEPSRNTEAPAYG